MGQRCGRVGSRNAIRWIQAKRLRAAWRSGRHPRVHANEERVACGGHRQSADSVMTEREAVLDVEQLQTVIRERAGEIEEARRLPSDLVKLLADAGCYRM